MKFISRKRGNILRSKTLKFVIFLVVAMSIIIFIDFASHIATSLFSHETSAYNSRDNYAGGLIPLKREINNIADYELATKTIIENLDKINVAREMRRDSYIDNLVAYQKDTLKMRFYTWFVDSQLKVDEGDTLIVFNAKPGVDHDMNMNSDWTYTKFEHSIFYTNKPVEVGEYWVMSNDDRKTPHTIIKIKDNYYYKIISSMEY